MTQTLTPKRTTCDLCGYSIDEMVCWPDFSFTFDSLGDSEQHEEFAEVCPKCVARLKIGLAKTIETCRKRKKP